MPTLHVAEKPLSKTKEEKPDETPKESEMETEAAKEDEKKDTTYDEIYFSSGSEDDEDNVGGVSSKSKERRAMKSDDELLYDPNMDDEDEKWVKQQRQGHHQGIKLTLMISPMFLLTHSSTCTVCVAIDVTSQPQVLCPKYLIIL